MNIKFANVDLDVRSRGDLSDLVRKWDRDLCVIARYKRFDHDCALFEIPETLQDPERVLLELLSHIRALRGKAKKAWDEAAMLVLDIGYFAANAVGTLETIVSTDTLAEIARLGISLRITIHGGPGMTVGDSIQPPPCDRY